MARRLHPLCLFGLTSLRLKREIVSTSHPIVEPETTTPKKSLRASRPAPQGLGTPCRSGKQAVARGGRRLLDLSHATKATEA